MSTPAEPRTDSTQARRTLARLQRDLRAVVVSGEVSFGARRRAEYAQDASTYRQVPAAVVLPGSTGELVGTLAVCHRYGVAVTLRGAGTSIAGQAVGDGVVVDTSRHLGAVLDVDPEARTARVEPGVVLDDLQKTLRPYGLRFGPDPSTHARCTIGGMIGNNACGTHSVAWGRTADNVVELDVVTYDGHRMTLRKLSEEELLQVIEAGGRRGEIHARLRDLRDAHLALLRTEFGRFSRQVSGYSLEHLLPERGFDPAAVLVGTEGTCAVVLAATVRLVPLPARRTLVALGFADLPAAGDAARHVLEHRPIACEGLGGDQVAALRRNVPDAEPEKLLPEGRGWLLCEFGYADAAEDPHGDRELAAALRRDTGALAVRLVADPAEQAALWRIREDSSGLATRAPDGSEAWPGWEDSAVPVEHLGDYLRDLQALLDRHGLQGTPYGHFGEGCVHIRIDFDHETPEGVRIFRQFMTDAARLVGSHGGTLSGEHGDGQARAEFLPLVYSPEAMTAFAHFKDVWDPENRLNPGILVHPRPADERLRIRPGHRPQLPLTTTLALAEDDGDLSRALRRCVGIAKCRTSTGGVMCPSYRATRDEKDSTRGRARVLYEMIQGEVVTAGWRSKEARESLDLCLSCKGCKSDCPVGVDMATYKSEFLHQHYRGRLRPVTHYTLGRLPVWARLAGRAPRLANAVTQNPFAAALLKRAGGIAPQRAVPPFAPQRFRRWFEGRTPSEGDRQQVLLWPDTFTEYFTPEVGRAAVEVLEAAGFEVLLPPDGLCCGLTWLTTGQLDTARRVLDRTLSSVDPYLRRGIPLVGLEPSCTSLFRSDGTELLAGDDRARRAAEQTLTFAELLDRHAPDAAFDRLGATALTQTHCHQHATLGSAADDRVLARLGVDSGRLDSGCCGLAGNFGFERGHYEVSVQVGEQALLPALRAAPESTVVLADGFSCRTQIQQLSDRKARHLAELLRGALPGAGE
ncbi:FAD-binding and (Fe-S)-binding domain-containing protein [Streptomyces cavernicola]|uniref:FAD-linked oxidase C-terminal domain-containing protein n=1 Tax=Streptomyces cavernicola TaxID=3043613 RepID=A0ABT6S663_9ACTN|nr:FAD-binding and (Fe-S)-binding domain-containing protein [Streptomyces sp. B-S-A6]MDI3403579.1 FAD-linked oxidase C-terminal domain-containing protein [Streptomyces sp. B-S-A6]